MNIKMLKRNTTIVLAGLLVTASSMTMASGGHDHGYSNFCSKTTRVAYTACKNDIKDDYWLAAGVCINITDDEERHDCLVEARQDKKENRKLCHEQREARDEVCDAIGEARFDPNINPANFVDPLEIGVSVAANTYMPLLQGFTRIYESGDETITVTVTSETIDIMGVKCIVVRDTVEEDGVLIEDTVDWFAQDIAGNVWYFGEISKNYEEGMLVDLDGSWKAGSEGAKAGIVMKAAPQVGDVYRQEWALGEAEDMGEVLSLSASATSPAADCNNNCLQTRDFTPLEPDVNENKFYAPGIGVIVALDVEEPDEPEQLVEYHY